MLTPFTIDSDEEVEPEVMSDEEAYGHNTATAASHAKKGKIFSFTFDDGVVSEILSLSC